MLRSRGVVLLLPALALIAGCSCSGNCDFPVRCVTTCGGAETTACGSCPAGTMPLSRCIDASVTDGGSDASSDAGSDVGRTDASTDAASDGGHDAAADDAALVCDRPGYPVDSTATRSERTDVETAAAAFTALSGATPDLDATTAAVTGFSVPFAVAYDTTITDACARALDAVQHFVAANDAMMRMPTDMMMRACDYDALTDSEIVRIHGGTYDGRRLIGVDNDLVVHVTRSGMIRYWGGSYLPVTERLFPQPCFDPAAVGDSLVGDSLHYMRFSACVPGATGSIIIQASDSRSTGDSALYIDASGLIHVARRVEVLLLASHVTPAEEGSDLYCCPSASLDGCVGNFVIVDEITLEVLQEQPRCITC